MNAEDLTDVVQQLQQQMVRLTQENVGLQQRLAAAEQQAAQAPAMASVLQALQGLPDAIDKLSKPKAVSLVDPKGLGKPQTLGEQAEDRFRLWAVKLEDYVTGVFGGKSREVLEWAASNDSEITLTEIGGAYGSQADLIDQWDEVYTFDEQLYTVLRATTESTPFDLVENTEKGRGLEAWRSLHRKYDPSTGGRKRAMLNALTSPERATYDTLAGALERWKALRSRYDRKRDQLGNREVLPDSLAMNALERLVPKDLEQHLMLNYSRFKTFEEMEKEVATYMEARTGSKLLLSNNFSKASGSEVIPMDVDSLVKAVSGTLSSLVGKGGKGKGSTKTMPKFEGKCDNCGKMGHKKKDCWAKGGGASGKGKGGGGSSSRGASSSPKKFEGKCDNCGKVGHKKRDCWSKPGGSHKGKGRGRDANSLDQPEQEPNKEASGIELCALEGVHQPQGSASRAALLAEGVHQPQGPAANAALLAEKEEEVEVEVGSPAPNSEDWSTVTRVRPKSESPSGEPGRIYSFSEEHPGWIKCNLDTGASVTAIPVEYKPHAELTSDSFKTASGELIMDYGKVKLEGRDERGVKRVLNGNATEVHKILVSAAKLHAKGYNSWIGPGGGEILPLDHPVTKALGVAYDKAVEEFGKEGIIPLREERGVYNFYLKMGDDDESASAVEHSASVSPTSVASSPKSSKKKVSFKPPEPAGPPPWKRPKEPAGPPPKKRGRVSYEVRSVPKRGQINAFEDEAIEVEESARGEEPPEESAEVESRRANPGWTPPDPTPQEQQEHEASGHAVYRSWCPECVRARGVSQQHRRVPHGKDLLPTISLDYYYMNDDRAGDDSKPGLVAVDRDTGMMMATAIARKGVVDNTAQKLLARFMELLGYKELVLKSDGERPLVKMKVEAAKIARGVRKAISEESPQGDSKANGHAEAAVRELKWRVRAIHLMINKKFGEEVNEDHPLVTWMPRYAAEQCNRFKVGEDGRTPEERRTGKRWIKPMPLFGEKILVKPAGKGKRGDPAKMVEGRYVGTHNRFGSILAMTQRGVVVGTGYHSVPESEKWGKLEDDLKGSPWNVESFALKKPEAEEERVVVVPMALPGPGGAEGERAAEPAQPPPEAEEDPGVGMPSGGPPRPAEKRQRAWPVRRELLAKYGKTPGCDGCISVGRGAGYQQIQHSEDCRNRIRQRVADEVEAEKEKRRKQEAEDEAEQRVRAEKRERAEEEVPVPMADTAGEPSSSSGGSKRKGGEGGAQDIDDLVREAEDPMEEKAERIQALVTTVGSSEVVKTLMEIGAIDVLELFSPQRVTKELKRFGLRKGVAVDLEEMKPDGSEAWDLDREDDYQMVLEMISKEEPLLVTSSPPCEVFSPLRGLSNFKRDPETVREEEELGRERLRKSMSCCKEQADQGRFYLHEHPKNAKSWEEEEVKEMRNREDTHVVQSPMCRFGMTSVGPDGKEGYVRKETLFMTNSKAIAEELEGVCSNQLKGKLIHRHVHLIGGGRAKAAQVYPVALVESVLRGLKKEMEERKWINSFEEEFTGPSPDDYVAWEEQVAENQEIFLDDVSGAVLRRRGWRSWIGSGKPECTPEFQGGFVKRRAWSPWLLNGWMSTRETRQSRSWGRGLWPRKFERLRSQGSNWPMMRSLLQHRQQKLWPPCFLSSWAVRRREER